MAARPPERGLARDDCGLQCPRETADREERRDGEHDEEGVDVRRDPELQPATSRSRTPIATRASTVSAVMVSDDSEERTPPRGGNDRVDHQTGSCLRVSCSYISAVSRDHRGYRVSLEPLGDVTAPPHRSRRLEHARSTPDFVAHRAERGRPAPRARADLRIASTRREARDESASTTTHRQTLPSRRGRMRPSTSTNARALVCTREVHHIVDRESSSPRLPLEVVRRRRRADAPAAERPRPA